ncbi:unnamed protein product, partial [marine sediment metagenome]
IPHIIIKVYSSILSYWFDIRDSFLPGTLEQYAADDG